MARPLLLQPRLQALADWVQTPLVDVGTDHGYLPVWLLQSGRIPSAIATDLREEPLRHARRTAALYGVELDFRLCDGLAGVAPEEAQTIVIAGMGGEIISAILAAAAWTRDGCHTLLLQPMSRAELLRKWLAENGYRFLRERLVRDKGTLYPVMELTGGQMPPLSAGACHGGVLLQHDPLNGAYLEQQIHKFERVLAGLSQARDGSQKEAQCAQTLRELAMMREELTECPL